MTSDALEHIIGAALLAIGSAVLLVPLAAILIDTATTRGGK